MCYVLIIIGLGIGQYEFEGGGIGKTMKQMRTNIPNIIIVKL